MARLFEDLDNAEVLLGMDTEMVRAENAELSRALDITRTERDVLERVLTNGVAGGFAGRGGLRQESRV
jgi:hypothetical protein